LVKASVMTFATFEVLSLVVGVGWGWIHTLGASDVVTSWITPVDVLAKIAPISSTSFLHVAHLVGPIIAIAVSLYAFSCLPRWGLPRVIGVTLLAVVLLSAIVQPWYLVWATVILSVTAGPKVSSAICLLSVSVSLIGVVGLGQLSSEWGSLTTSLQVLSLLLVAVAALVPIEAPAARSVEMSSGPVRRWIPAPMLLLRRAQ
jgi:alpha-1,6-mannosyltransferase